MRITFNKFRFFRDLVINKTRRRQVPLFLYWFVTDRCNYRCSYCYGAFHRNQGADLPTEVMLRMADEMAHAGVRRVNLIGGEPLMREDIGLIVDRLARNRISVCILSNGSRLPERIEAIRNVDEVGMSIDGSEQRHDAIRGRGAFQELKLAIAACRQRGLTVVLTYTMVSQNIDDLDDVMEFVKEQGVQVTVNIAHGRILGARDLPVSRASNEEYRQALRKIIAYHERGYPVFRARRTMELMQQWNDYQSDTSDISPGKSFPTCLFGSYGATLYADGRLVPCFLNSRGGTGRSVPEHGFPSAWEHCQAMAHCTYCHVPCFIEYNSIFALSLPILFNAGLKLSVYPVLARILSGLGRGPDRRDVRPGSRP